jgi:putative methyltransferase (TIGR04325 family)
MNIARVLKRITPPILFDIFRRSAPAELWAGIYSRYADVPVAGPGFDGEVWINQTKAYTKRMLAASESYGSIPFEVTGEHMLLPLVAALVCEQSGGRVGILDFGGGLGVGYVYLLSSLVNCGSIDYHVVERERVCEEGARLFEHDKRIRFHPRLPAELGQIDILYISSALQYVEDYPALLKALTAFRAKYFLFVKLSAGDFPTYATAQKNVSGTTLPYWFINVGEIIELMAAEGYSLKYKSALERQYDQSNFPDAHRLGRTCNLLFLRD